MQQLNMFNFRHIVHHCYVALVPNQIYRCLGIQFSFYFILNAMKMCSIKTSHCDIDIDIGTSEGYNNRHCKSGVVEH